MPKVRFMMHVKDIKMNFYINERRNKKIIAWLNYHYFYYLSNELKSILIPGPIVGATEIFFKY